MMTKHAMALWQKARHVVQGSLLAVLCCLLVACPRQRPEDNTSGNPEQTSSKSPQADLAIADRGHKALVEAFLDACRKGDTAVVEARMTEHARSEAKSCYGSLQAYADACRKNVEGYVEILFSQYSPFHRADDVGDFCDVRLGSKDKGLTLAFYLESGNDGVMRIDHVLTPQSLNFPYVAPALGPQIPLPEMAFFVYYYGAVRALHPGEMLLRSEVTSEVSVAERLAYLRSSCLDGFIRSIEKDEDYRGDMLMWLDVGKQAMEHYADPQVERSGFDHFVDISLIPNSGTGWEPLFRRFTVARRHGQCRIERNEDAPPME